MRFDEKREKRKQEREVGRERGARKIKINASFAVPLPPLCPNFTCPTPRTPGSTLSFEPAGRHNHRTRTRPCPSSRRRTRRWRRRGDGAGAASPQRSPGEGGQRRGGGARPCSPEASCWLLSAWGRVGPGGPGRGPGRVASRKREVAERLRVFFFSLSTHTHSTPSMVGTQCHQGSTMPHSSVSASSASSCGRIPATASASPRRV